MKKVVVLFLFLFSLFITAHTQPAVIKGAVLCNGEPVAFASVGLKNTAIGITTGVDGKYSLTCPEGKYTLIASAVGYAQFQAVINVSSSTIIQDITLTKLENNLQEVVVSGTLKEILRSESPIVVDIITPKLFQKNPTPNLFDAMQMVNGVQPQINCSVCSTGDIHINGMEGPYTMITIDGMPIVSGLSTVYGLSGIPNSLINRIEVVKGPSSTLYGSEAVAGLVNVITKSPETASSVAVDVLATSQGEYNTDLGIKYKLGKSHSLLGVNYFNFNNRIDNNHDGFTDITLQNRVSVFNKWKLDRKNGRQFSIAGRFIYEDRFGGEMNWMPEFRGTDSIYGESIYTTRYELIGNYQLPFDKEKLYLQFSFNDHNQNSFYGNVPYMAVQKVAFAQLLWDKKLGSRHDITAGLPLRYTYYDDNTYGTKNIELNDTVNAPQQVLLPGIFVQDQFTLSDKVVILAGSRYDYNTDHGSIISPRLNVKYSYNKNNALRVGIGNGYRVVNLFTEDHAALTGARSVEIAERLRPEKSWNGNLSYQHSRYFKNGFMIVDAGAFYTYFSNKIIPDYETDPQKIIYSNIKGYGVSKGINLNLDLNFSNFLKVLAGGTLMDVYNVNTTGIKTTQLFAPHFSGTYAISYAIARWDVSFDYTGIVKSPMHLPVVPNDFRAAKSPWFSIQNIQVTKKIKNTWELYAGIKNLLNFIPVHPILRPFDPFDKNIDNDNPYGYTFDTSYNYSSLQGIRGFLGFRYNLQ